VRGEEAGHASERGGVRVGHVNAERAVDVDVDEAGEEGQAVEVEDAGGGRVARAGFVEDGGDAPAFDEQRLAFRQTVGQDEARAAQEEGCAVIFRVVHQRQLYQI
jgi:hypothetical protein